MAYDKAADAERLKAIFERVVTKGRGETPDQFGRRAGLGKGANVRHYLNGRNALTVDTARKFALHIPCAIEQFSPHFARIAQATGQIATNKVYAPLFGETPLELQAEEASGIAPTSEQPTSGITIRIPLLSWGQVEFMLEENSSLIGSSGIDFADASGEDIGSRTKYLVMPDDSMSPRICEGDRLTVEPDWRPEPGEITLFRDSAGAHHVRVYRQIRPGHFQAAPANTTDYTTLDSIADGLTPIGVITARREFLAKRKR